MKTYTPAKVISVSYGETEYGLPSAYQKRECNEFMKLGLQGVSFLTSSGDEGLVHECFNTKTMLTMS